MRVFAVSMVAIWVGLAVVEAVPAVAALAALAVCAVVYPLALVVGSGRAAQRAVEVFEAGVAATERRRLLRFRRYAPFLEVVSGSAWELAPGKFAAQLQLMDGTWLESIPGELSASAVEYLNLRTGEQVKVTRLQAGPEKGGKRIS